VNINLHIERLIVDDLGIQPQQRDELKAAVAAAIRRQIVSQGIGSTMQAETSRSSVSGGSFSIENNPSIESLGQQIAQSVYGGIGCE